MNNVKNFWIKLKIDGKEKMIEVGPRSAEGGFEMSIGMRNKNGGICEQAIKINGFAKVNAKNKKKRDLRVEIGDSVVSNMLKYEN